MNKFSIQVSVKSCFLKCRGEFQRTLPWFSQFLPCATIALDGPDDVYVLISPRLRERRACEGCSQGVDAGTIQRVDDAAS